MQREQSVVPTIGYPVGVFEGTVVPHDQMVIVGHNFTKRGSAIVLVVFKEVTGEPSIECSVRIKRDDSWVLKIEKPPHIISGKTYTVLIEVYSQPRPRSQKIASTEFPYTFT